MSKITELIRRFTKELALLAEDGRTWGNWVGFKKRNFHDLKELVAGNYKEGFKRRALLVILAPHQQFIPFEWEMKADSLENYLFPGGIELKGLNMNLLHFAAELVCEFKQLLQERPHLVKDHARALSVYDDYLLELLALLPCEEKERVYNLFSLHDAGIYWNLEQASGYNPFEKLLRSEGIREMYKMRADDKMRAIILGELRGELAPRAEHEGALKCYARIIQMFLYRKNNLPYSIQLFASQINFIISLPSAGEMGLIESWHVGELLDLFTGDGFRELRHRIARFVLFENSERFQVYSSETLSAAERTLAEFGAQDHELRRKLTHIVAGGRELIAKNQEAQRAQKAREDAITERMRVYV